MSAALAHSGLNASPRLLRRTAIVGTVVAAVLLLFAAPALAHITVSPDSAPAGSAAVLTFHVPNEEASASTVKVDMQIPTDHPIAQLLVKPVPGWTISVRTITLAKPVVTDDGKFTQAVSEVIWSGGQILPGQFQDFTVSADPLPAGVSQLAFKAIQTYSNGDVVRWIDLQQPGQQAPDHPAPVLRLSATTTPVTAAPAANSGGSAADGTARLLGEAGLLLGFLAGLLALTVAVRARRLTALVRDRAGTPARPDRAGQAADEDAIDQVLAGAKAARGDQVSASTKPGAQRGHQGPAGTKAAARRNPPRRRG